MSSIKIVRGNSFYLHVPIVRYTVGGSSSEEITPLDISSVKNLTFYLVNTYGQRFLIPFDISGASTNTAILYVSADFICGTYSLEIVGQLNGNPIRSYKRNVLTLVQSNDECNVFPLIYNGKDSYTTEEQEIPEFTYISIGNIKQLENIIIELEKKLSKVDDDEAAGNIKFLKNITVNGESNVRGNENVGGNQVVEGTQMVKGDSVVGDYAPGLFGKGSKITSSGNGEMRSLKLWEFLEVPELRYNRATVHTGVDWLVAGGGIIESVTVDTKTNADGTVTELNSGVVTLHLEDGQIGSIADGAFCMGIFHNFGGSNDTENKDSHTGNFNFAGFCTVYFYIDEILDTSRNSKFHYILRDKSSSWSYLVHPSPSMTFAEYANNKHKERQCSVYSTTEYTIGLKDMTTWEFGDGNIYRLEGYIDGWTVSGKTFKGYGNVIGNAYVFGDIDTFEKIESKLNFDLSGDNMISEGQTKHIKSIVTNGYGSDVTSEYTKWSITRNTGDESSDNIWNASALIGNNGEFDISWISGGKDDLGGKNSALFSVVASNDTTKISNTIKI